MKMNDYIVTCEIHVEGKEPYKVSGLVSAPSKEYAEESGRYSCAYVEGIDPEEVKSVQAKLVKKTKTA